MDAKIDAVEVLKAISDRVKCVDIHPTEPLVLAALHTGFLITWNYKVI